jgi:hypothetical protein
MAELRNLRQYHIRDRRQIARIQAKTHARLDTLGIQIAELQAVVFGRKPRPPCSPEPAKLAIGGISEGLSC